MICWCEVLIATAGLSDALVDADNPVACKYAVVDVKWGWTWESEWGFG